MPCDLENTLTLVRTHDLVQGLDLNISKTWCLTFSEIYVRGKHPSQCFIVAFIEAETHLRSYLIFGEQVGDVLMPPLRCFFLGDRADCCSSSTTETPETV